MIGQCQDASHGFTPKPRYRKRGKTWTVRNMTDEFNITLLPGEDAIARATNQTSILQAIGAYYCTMSVPPSWPDWDIKGTVAQSGCRRRVDVERCVP
jgi:hypothetical protein